MDETTYPVTLVKVGPGLPVFEVGVYTYTGPSLPYVGDTISIRRAASDGSEAPEELQGYVTRIKPMSNSPISVLEAKSGSGDAASTDDYLVAPSDDQREWTRAAGL
jgi:hypothetical protein